MSEATIESLEVNGLTMDDIDVLIPHQANLRMLEAIVERVEAPQEKVFVNVEDEKIRTNRLTLLKKINRLFADRVADLSQILIEDR